MKIVIDIPEYLYDHLHDMVYDDYALDDYELAIFNGRPLPKGHGDLIYAEDAIETLQIMFARDNDIQNACEQCILDCPTIIEADTESGEA